MADEETQGRPDEAATPASPPPEEGQPGQGGGEEGTENPGSEPA